MPSSFVPFMLKVYTEWDLPKERERPELVVSASDVRGALDKQHRGSGTDGGRGIQLLDARASVQYTGQCVTSSSCERDFGRALACNALVLKEMALLGFSIRQHQRDPHDQHLYGLCRILRPSFPMFPHDPNDDVGA